MLCRSGLLSAVPEDNSLVILAYHKPLITRKSFFWLGANGFHCY